MIYLYKKIRFIILILILFCSVGLQGQSEETHHFINVWGAGGYANLFNSVPYTRAIGGPGALVGFGYELNYKRFVFNFGLEFDYKYVNIGRDDFRMDVDMIDTEGDDMVFHY